MTRTKYVLLAGATVLALVLAFGCSLLPRDDRGMTAGAGWYIKLQIQAPAGSKGITVSEFDVTALSILVRDPDGVLLKDIDWEVGQGFKSYDVPVKQLGEYTIQVIHVGERDGEQVLATESAIFTIRAMKITVIDIVPGCIGVIRVAGEGGGTISGRVYDYLTGAGIVDATVVFGDYSANTDDSGAYLITVPESVTTVQGVFAAFKGLDYKFRACGTITLDPASDPVFDVALMPDDPSGYVGRSLGGTIRDSAGAGIGEGHLWLSIGNEKGGRGWSEANYMPAAFSTSTKTFGSSCFVTVDVADPSDNPLFLYYLSDQDLSIDLSDYNLQKPPSSAYRTVTLEGSQYSMFQGYLVVPGYGWVSYASGDLASSPQATLELYNPKNYPMCWLTQTAVFDAPGPGDMSISMHAQTMPFSEAIDLPAPYTHAAPSGTVDGTTAVWTASTRTLAWEAVNGANAYVVFLADYSADDPHFYGYILGNSSSITLPVELVSAVMNTAHGWDLGIWTAWSPQADEEKILEFNLRFDSGGQGPPLGDFQAVVVESEDVTKYDIIP